VKAASPLAITLQHVLDGLKAACAILKALEPILEAEIKKAARK